MARFRAVWLGLLLCALVVGVCGVSAQVTLNLDERLSPSDAAKRDALLQPGIAALNRGDDAAASRAFLSVLITYPNDLSVLRYAAAAAMGAGQNEQALGLFQRALAQIPNKPWPLRTTIIVLEARLNRWDDFDRDLKVLRQAKKAGMDHGLDDGAGFVIDEFESGRGRVQAVVYPLESSRYHTLYRFLLPTWVEITPPSRASAKGPEPAQPARCHDPDFQPYFDVESDDVDQAEFAKAHPDEAKKGGRSHMLDSYGTPCTQALVKFYPDGEPTYEAARADVVKALMTPGGPAKP